MRALLLAVAPIACRPSSNGIVYALVTTRGNTTEFRLLTE
jgi:hypothetical protein